MEAKCIHFLSSISVAHLEEDSERATSTYSPELSHRIITGRPELRKSTHRTEVWRNCSQQAWNLLILFFGDDKIRKRCVQPLIVSLIFLNIFRSQDKNREGAINLPMALLLNDITEWLLNPLNLFSVPSHQGQRSSL